MASSTISNHWHPRLIEAAAALHDNRLDIAERILKPHLKEDPFDVRAIRMLAELAGRIGRWHDAENLLRRAVELAPGWTAARANLALVLGRMGRPAEAMALLDDILAEEPDWVGHWNLKAATLGRLGSFEDAIALYEDVLARAPKQPRAWVSYGHMLKTVGRQQEGIAAYRKAIDLNPALGEAWWKFSPISRPSGLPRPKLLPCATRWQFPIFRTATASISNLRSARRCMMLAAPMRRSRTMRTGTRCGGVTTRIAATRSSGRSIEVSLASVEIS